MLSGGKYALLLKAFQSNQVFAFEHPYDLYRNWLEAVWAFCDAVRDPEAFRSTLDRYTADQGREIGRLMNLYVEVVEQHPFEDVLGELFMQLDVKSAAAGQYFTPGPIAELMARMTFNVDEFHAKVAEKGNLSICDPACGSGVMLLKIAKVVAEQLGRGALRHLRLYGQDIDQRCVNMARIQLRFNGLDSFGRLAGSFAGETDPGSPAGPVAPPAESEKVIISALSPTQLELF